MAFEQSTKPLDGTNSAFRNAESPALNEVRAEMMTRSTASTETSRRNAATEAGSLDLSGSILKSDSNAHKGLPGGGKNTAADHGSASDSKPALTDPNMATAANIRHDWATRAPHARQFGPTDSIGNDDRIHDKPAQSKPDDKREKIGQPKLDEGGEKTTPASSHEKVSSPKPADGHSDGAPTAYGVQNSFNKRYPAAKPFTPTGSADAVRNPRGQ